MGFVLGTIALLLSLVFILVYVAHVSQRRDVDLVDWKPTRSPEVEAQNEVDDVAQMIEAANERRRRLGKPERTLEQVELSVMEAQRERARMRAEASERDADIDDMLALKNERRARKGLPPITREQYEADLNL